MTSKKLESFYKSCKNCGSSLTFSPSNQSLKCSKCGSIFEIEKNVQVNKHDLNKKQDDNSQEYKDYVKQNKIFKCSNCGSDVVLNIYEISKTCPYCGTSLVIQKNELPGLVPDGVLPFLFEKEEASNKFSISLDINRL